MKIKTALLAPSVAALGLAISPAASAQSSSVTLYGVLDIAVESHNNTPGGTVTGMRSSGQSGSRWGLRGVEDLGNGLKAVFQLESGFGVRNGIGDGRLFQRTAMVGLTGNWGALTFGRQYTSSFDLAAAMAPLGFSPLYEGSGRYVPTRADNMIKYRGAFGGLETAAYYSFRDQAEQIDFDEDATGSYGVAARYKLGAFRVMGGYDRLEAPGGSATTGKTDNILVAADATFGDFRVTGLYRYRKVRQLVVEDIKSNFWTVGLNYQFTPAASVQFGYYLEDFKNAPQGYLGTTDDKWQQFALRGVYSISKRTNLYAVVGHARKGPLNFGSNNDVGGPAYTLAADETKQTGAAIGIRHMF